MKKFLLIFLSCIAIASCAFALTSCNKENKDSNPAPVAGLFELKDIPFFYENLLITKYDYQFYTNGTVKTTVYASAISGNYSDVKTNYGTYVWYEGTDFIYVSWSGSSNVIDLKYTGESITNGIMTNYFAGANDNGEVAGKLALASYSVHTYANYYVSNAGGTIRGEKEQYIKKGENATTVTAVPNDGFEFIGWSDGITEAERHDVNVTDNIIVTANFKQVDEIYKLNYEAGYGGKIEGEEYQEVAEGRNASTVKAVSIADSYVFVKWSDGVTTAERTDLNVTENINVTAEFSWALPFTYVASEHGRIEGETTQYIAMGTYGTTVTAIPDEGYRFYRWSDDLTTATRRDEHTEHINKWKFTAYFLPDDTTPSVPDTPETPPVINYSLTYTAGAGGKIIGALSQTVESGKDGSSIIAIADDGYKFIGWSDGVQTAERQDTGVTDNITVTALFEVNTDFAGGNGTETRPYQIETAEQLLSVENYPLAYFVLIDDIMLEDNFTPMFSDDNMFNGVFDGNGHKISNLTIYNTTTFYAGLFACIGESGCVKNLILENVDLKGTNYIGAVAGYSLGVIENCTVNGEINYLSENSYKVFIGGIVGRIDNKIDKCSSNVNIICTELNGEANLGGLAGYIDGESLSLSDCFAVGNILCESKKSTLYAGGLFGYSGSINLINCYATGDITATGHFHTYVGGFIGQGYSITISNGYATGDITATGCEYTDVGGFVGSGRLTVSNSYTTGDITATGDYYAYAGGFMGSGGGGSTINVTSSYTVSKISVASEGTVYSGAFAGYTDNFKMTNAHWLYYEDSGVEYAIGYSDSMGIPSSIGSTKHTTISDFYTLADALNTGLETPVWENVNANSLPTLKKGNGEEI